MVVTTDSDLCPYCRLPACPTWRNRHPQDDYSILVARHGTPLPFRQQHQHGTLIQNMEHFEERLRQEALALRLARAQAAHTTPVPVVETKPAWLTEEKSRMVPAYDENGDPAENSLLPDFKHLCLPTGKPLGTIFSMMTKVGRIYLETIAPPPAAAHRLIGPAVFVRRIIDDTGPLKQRILHGETKVLEITPTANFFSSSER